MAVRCHLAQSDKEIVHLLRRQHCGWLVKDQQRRPPIECFDDLHALTFAHGQCPHGRARVNVQPIGAAQLVDSRLHPIQIQERATAGGQPQRDIFGHRERIHQHKMLVDHTDAQVNGGCGRSDGYGAAIEPDLAAVGRIETIENLHQRGFARAVFAQQRVNLATAHIKINGMGGQHARESLCNPGHFQMVNRWTTGGEKHWCCHGCEGYWVVDIRYWGVFAQIPNI